METITPWVDIARDVARTGWRPAMGWIAGIAAFYAAVVAPAAGLAAPNFEILSLVLGVAGVQAVARTAEKIKAVG